MKCKICGKKFPSKMLSPLVVFSGGQTTRVMADAICALKERNRVHGLPEDAGWTPGSYAHELYEEAVTYLKEEKEKK